MKSRRLFVYLVCLLLACVLLFTACNTQPSQLPQAASATLLPAERIPSPRAYTSIAYDIESDRVILFGGQTGDYKIESSYNGETWAYDAAANNWTRMKPSPGPSPRSAPELVYDFESDRVIMFGGCGGVSKSLWGMADTWAYDFNTNTWKAMSENGPKSHIGDRLVYDFRSPTGSFSLAVLLFTELITMIHGLMISIEITGRK